jgi:hypothetical protein
MSLAGGLISVWHMNGDWLDSFGSNDATAVGATFDSVNQKLGVACGNFDGTDDLIHVGPAVIQSAGTLSFWMRPNWNSGDSANRILFESIAGNSWFRLQHFQDNNWYFQWVTGGIGFNVVISSATMVVVSGVWSLMTITWDDAANTMEWFQNTVSKGVRTLPLTTHALTNNFYMGATSGNTINYNGKYDEVATWGRVLTSAEIAEVWNGGSGIEIPPTIAAAGRRRRMLLGRN